MRDRKNCVLKLILTLRILRNSQKKEEKELRPCLSSSVLSLVVLPRSGILFG